MKNINELDEVYSEFKPEGYYVKYENSKKEVYIESFEFKNGELVNPKPITIGDLSYLSEMINNNRKGKERLISEGNLEIDTVFNPNILFLKERPLSLCWFIPSGKREFKFSGSMRIKGTEFAHPGIIFFYKSRIGINYNFSVYTTKTDNVNMNTTLYSPPFHNCRRDGYICMPSNFNRISKEKKLSRIISRIEDYFFKSNFSHIGEQTIEVKTSMNKLWRNMAKTDVFPSKILLKTDLKIKDLLHEKNSLHI